MTRRLFTLLLFFCMISFQGYSQVYPISTFTTVTPPYPVSLDGFVEQSANKINLQIRVNDATLANYPVKLRLVLKNNNVTIATSPAYLSQPLYLNGGDILVLNAFDLTDFFRVENLDFIGYSKNQYNNSGQLPDGIYQMSFEVVDYNRNFTISSSVPSFVYIYVNEPPILNLPFNKTQMDFNAQQNIMFNWTFRHSPFSRPGLVPEYVFELWEVYPENLNPYFVAQSTKPVYTETLNGTSLNYTVMHPLLIPGRKYAWRIRVTDPEGITRFKSDGYSDIYWFKYGINCTPPKLEVENVGAKHISVSWETEQLQDNYTVRYRPKNQSEEEWYSASSEFMSYKIDNLKANTEYVIEVGGMCSSQESGYSEQVTARTDMNLDYQCGASADIPEIENQEPLPQLLKGDFIKAGDFEVEVWSAEGSNGTFNGKGFVLVPLFNFLKLEADLQNIRVNTDYQLIGGNVKTVYNLSNSLTVNLGDIFGNGSGGTDEGEAEDNDFVNIAEVKINAGDSILSVVVTENSVTVTTGKGDITKPVSDKQIVAVTAPSGEQYVVDGTTNTVYTQASKNGMAPSGGSNGTAQASASDLQYTVTFEPSEQQLYGFDMPDEKSPLSSYDKKPLAGVEQYIPWKSIESGRFDKVKAIIEGVPSDSVYFSRESASMVMIAPTMDDNKKQLMITGDGHEDTDEMYAYYTVTRGDSAKTTTEYYAGSLNLISYEKKEFNLCLVSVNGSVAPGASYVQTELNEIYKQAIVQWQVTELSGGLSVELPRSNQKELDNTDVDNRMDYTDEMKLVKKAMKKHELYDNHTIYLFFFDEATDNQIKGYMPLKGQFGFIFKFEQWPDEYLHTIAHEVGHGPFRLRHTFSNDNPYKQNKGETNNLMDYAGPDATVLHKYQWDYIHKPETMLFAWLEDEEEGESSYETVYQKAGEFKSLPYDASSVEYDGDIWYLVTKDRWVSDRYLRSGYSAASQKGILFRDPHRFNEVYRFIADLSRLNSKIIVAWLVIDGSTGEEAIVVLPWQENSNNYINMKCFGFNKGEKVLMFENKLLDIKALIRTRPETIEGWTGFTGNKSQFPYDESVFSEDLTFFEYYLEGRIPMYLFAPTRTESPFYKNTMVSKLNPDLPLPKWNETSWEIPGGENQHKIGTLQELIDGSIKIDYENFVVNSTYHNRSTVIKNHVLYNSDLLRYEDLDGNEIEFSDYMNIIQEECLIIGGMSGPTEYSDDAKTRKELISASVGLGLTAMGKFFKEGSKLWVASSAVSIAMSFYSISNGGSPVEQFPVIGAAVKPLEYFAGWDEIEQDVEWQEAKNDYRKMCDFIDTHGNIYNVGFIYTSHDVFKDIGKNVYCISSDYMPTNIPRTISPSDSFGGLTLEYVYWGYLSEDGSMIIQGMMKYF